ncbi:hypothetical protein [Ancylobacter oerskovii]|uniref:Uncharacterized protein n=1 Tax=Ancylobacter oerskovii TaxID=459519 RepID=A0ABW4YR94_9HYPH|nr:hypothetical protein [Ancylobacter oerskovii]MBS7545658.1 hypothetical protein [Ancylobacter oerskovii]
MSKRVTDNELLDLVIMVKQKLGALPAIEPGNHQSMRAYHIAAADVLDELVREGRAKMGKPLGAMSLSMGGLRTSCTHGAAGLLKNWVAAAYRELDKRRMAA